MQNSTIEKTVGMIGSDGLKHKSDSYWGNPLSMGNVALGLHGSNMQAQIFMTPDDFNLNLGTTSVWGRPLWALGLQIV